MRVATYKIDVASGLRSTLVVAKQGQECAKVHSLYA